MDGCQWDTGMKQREFFYELSTPLRVAGSSPLCYPSNEPIKESSELQGRHPPCVLCAAAAAATAAHGPAALYQLKTPPPTLQPDWPWGADNH